MVFGHKGLRRELPKTNIASCWTWRSCDLAGLSAAPPELCREILVEIPPRRYLQRSRACLVGATRERRRWNAAVGKRWTSGPFKRRTRHYDIMAISQVGRSPKWVLMSCFQISRSSTNLVCSLVSHLFFPSAEASAEERGRGAKFMRWDGGRNTFLLMSMWMAYRRILGNCSVTCLVLKTLKMQCCS